jgi:hypothetical protein
MKCRFLDPPLIVGVIKLENLLLNEIQWSLSHRKACHRLSTDVFTNSFAGEVTSWFCLRNVTVLHDSLIPARRLTVVCLLVYLFLIFRHTQQFFSYMMAVSFYWWKREPRYIIQCIWGETTDLRQVNWHTFSHCHIGTSRIQTDVGWRWEASGYETDVLITQPRRSDNSW